MLPFSGQGANQAIEDAGALRILFENHVSPDEMPALLSLFENVRKLRVSRVQTMSSVRVGKEGEIQEELKKYADHPGAGKFHREDFLFKSTGRKPLRHLPLDVPRTFRERLEHDFR
jgi:salicylate hydroxylase